MTKSKMTAKGQTTVPAEIRQANGGTPSTRLVSQVEACLCASKTESPLT